MINNSKEVDSPTKQEGNTNDSKVSKPASSSSSSWLRLKDPRIVRVSRAFGGKDRHSKVCTIRGLRDRRVRLSVPTAIQLYDLQDRLGLNQPSKVVDWLLNAAKDEIDELPPLPIQPGSFAFNHQMVLTSSQEAAAADVASAAGSDAFWKAKSKEVARGMNDEKDEEERANHSSFPAMLNNGLPYGSYYHLEPSNFPLPLMGSHGFAPNTDDAAHNYNVAAPLPPSTLSLSSGSQIFVCPPGATQPLFPPHATTSADIDPRQQFNHFQMLSSSVQHLLPIPLNPPPAAYSINQSIRPFHFSMSSRLPHAHNGGGSQAEKQQQFPSK